MKSLADIGKKLTPDAVIFIIAVIGSILYISLTFNDNLWTDEAFTAVLIRGSWGEVLRDTVSDTLPPFYNLFGKLLTSVFGYSSWILKFSSCLPMMLLIFFGGRRLYVSYSFRAAFLYELFLIAMPNFLHYAVEIRMYSWGIFACGIAALYVCDIVNENSAWLRFTLFSVFAGYVHHFALVSCGMLWLLILIFLVVKKNGEGLKQFAKYLGLFTLLYLPCLILAVYQIKNASSYFMMAPLTVNSFLSDLRSPFVTNVTALSALLLLTMLSILILSLVLLIKTKRAQGPGSKVLIPGLFLFSVFFLTLLFGYAVSLAAGRSIFTARYLVPSLSIFWMGVAVLADKVLSAFGDKMLPAAFLIALITASGVTDYMQAFNAEYDARVETMKAFFNASVGEDDIYLTDEDSPQIEICFSYYFPYLKKTDWENIDETGGKIWFIKTGNLEKMVDKAHEHGYNVEYMGDFAFDRYSFFLYEIRRP